VLEATLARFPLNNDVQRWAPEALALLPAAE